MVEFFHFLEKHPRRVTSNDAKKNRSRSKRKRVKINIMTAIMSFGLLCFSAVIGLTRSELVQSSEVEEDDKNEMRNLTTFHESTFFAVPPNEIVGMQLNTHGYPPLRSNRPDIHGYPWQFIAEPYKTTVIRIDDETESRSFDSHFTWEIIDHYGAVTQLEGNEVQHIFTDATKKSAVTLRKWDRYGNLVGSRTEEVICKYVRREVRELLPEDLSNLLDTMQIIWKLPTQIGKLRYGNRYKGIDFFTFKHMALTMEFEQSLQSMEPSLSVPYWDFTIDAEIYGADWSIETPVLDDNAFGPGMSSSYVVNRGRWAYTPLGNADDYYELTSFHNSYGLLRPEWNNNRYPFLTRWHTIAGSNNTRHYPNDCDDYWQSLHDQSWADISLDANTRAHGFLHGLLGGVWYEYKDWVKLNYVMPLGSGPTYLKYFWRSNFLKCPKYCSPDALPSDCTCHCDYGEYTWEEALDVVNDSLSETVYKDHISLMYMYLMDQLPDGFDSPDDYLKYVFDGLVCDPGSIGDNFDSESTVDPTFWPMHPTFDRLLHWMRLSPEPFEYNWGVDKFSCRGHNPEDVIPFEGLFPDDEPGSGPYTNEILYNKLDPTNEMLPYVYSNFEWPHCESLGYDMSNENLRKKTLKSYRRPNEMYEFSSVDWSVPWSQQRRLPKPSELIRSMRAEFNSRKPI